MTAALRPTLSIADRLRQRVDQRVDGKKTGVSMSHADAVDILAALDVCAGAIPLLRGLMTGLAEMHESRQELVRVIDHVNFLYQ